MRVEQSAKPSAPSSHFKGSFQNPPRAAQMRMQLASLKRRIQCSWTTSRWLQWIVVYTIPMSFFLADKLVALSAILTMFASKSERTAGTKTAGIFLGMLEDFIMTTLLITALLLLELVRKALSRFVRVPNVKAMKAGRIVGHILRFTLVFTLVALTLAPFAADLVLIRSRGMRFTTDFITTYRREKAQAANFEVDTREVKLARNTGISVGVLSLVFAIVYTLWVDLIPNTRVVQDAKEMEIKTPCVDDVVEPYQSLEEGHTTSGSPQSSPRDSAPHVDASYTPIPMEVDATVQANSAKKWYFNRKLCLTVICIIAYVVLIIITRSIATAVSPVVAAIALNTTLNELFRNYLDVEFIRGSASSTLSSAGYYLHSETEDYTLFEDDVLYRRTTGFKGPLAFDVTVDKEDPPNVLVLVVESYRYLDSLYLTANTTAGAVMKKHNLTVTPSFDRWAKRGIAFDNMWSSWQTSRSLESILFGQIVYDSITESGTTWGREKTKLEGMPQFFKQKDYETVFSTGCVLDYDQWDKFLPSHGFETVLGEPDYKKLAETDYNIAEEDWYGPAHRGYNWGVHDDLTFAMLGDLMLNKTAQQKDRVAQGDKKKPFFLNHYTISSHTTFDSIPAWFSSVSLPDFSPLCEGWESECDLIQRYAKLRYFTDMEMGKFLDRMKSKGVLEDTIVVVVGDHGQSPEFGLTTCYNYQTATTHVAGAMIAEGRLGKHAGMVNHDATHHYDLLNTLADIVGVPEGGFLQTGVGRSLKRKIPFGSRPVWSNNPLKKMSIIQGHMRLVYDRSVNSMGLFDTVKDPLEKNDLLPALSDQDTAKMHQLRRAGRELSSYFTHRWEKKCLTKVDC